ncbi:hypothetical protein BDA99DRAFT_133855 [Phascolomyces articulosus]|uniref:Uncharacterized protein n=1 Tax=Phascolomyces articulosus TaxID=60185 RepID=A0AAD5PBR4_9FUNG|nr:hypothetical protein BDA99DRAFT_133855 [Phascolomyces articulosus]
MLSYLYRSLQTLVYSENEHNFANDTMTSTSLISNVFNKNNNDDHPLADMINDSFVIINESLISIPSINPKNIEIQEPDRTSTRISTSVSHHQLEDKSSFRVEEISFNPYHNTFSKRKWNPTRRKSRAFRKRKTCLRNSDNVLSRTENDPYLQQAIASANRTIQQEQPQDNRYNIESITVALENNYKKSYGKYSQITPCHDINHDGPSTILFDSSAGNTIDGGRSHMNNINNDEANIMDHDKDKKEIGIIDLTKDNDDDTLHQQENVGNLLSSLSAPSTLLLLTPPPNNNIQFENQQAGEFYCPYNRCK